MVVDGTGHGIPWQVPSPGLPSVATMVVEKRGNKWCVVHCHGPDKGKVIKCFPTRKQAEAMHRAIQANKEAEKLLERMRAI